MFWRGGIQHLCLEPVPKGKIVAVVGKKTLKPRLVELWRLTFLHIVDELERNLLAVDGGMRF